MSPVAASFSVTVASSFLIAKSAALEGIPVLSKAIRICLVPAISTDVPRFQSVDEKGASDKDTHAPLLRASNA